MSYSQRNLMNYFLYLGLAIGICHPFIYFSTYSGDGIIHLIFAKNALDGHFFEFNIGKFTGGETSPGFMFILAALMNVYGEDILPAFVKMISILMLYSIGFLTYRLAKLLNLQHPFPALAGVVALLLPGTTYNGQFGTESSWFAAGILLLTYGMLKRGWLIEPTRFSLIEEVLLGICFGLLFLIRPEAAPYAGIIYIYRLVTTSGDRHTFIMSFKQGIGAFVGFALVAGTFLWFYWAHTGILPYSAGVARSILSKMDNSIDIGFVSINLRFLERVLYYCFLTIPALLAAVLLFRKRIVGNTAKMTGLFLTIFGFFFILYSTVLPSVHLARYTIFLWPFLILAATVALALLWENFPKSQNILTAGRNLFFAGLALLFFAVILAETYIRTGIGVVSFIPSFSASYMREQMNDYNFDVSRTPNTYVYTGKGAFRSILAVSYVREQMSDQLFKEFGSPVKLPINIAVQEVQIRYWLDDRFVVYSLDGIVDNKLTEHICDGYYDHIGYFLDRDVDFFMPIKSYNKDKSVWSLGELINIETGERINKFGVELVKLSNGWLKVDKTVHRSEDSPETPCESVLK